MRPAMGTWSRPSPRGQGSCENSLCLRAKYREAARSPITHWQDLICLGRVNLCVSFKPISFRHKYLLSSRTCISTTWPGRWWDHKPGLPGHLGDPPPRRNVCQPGSGRLWAPTRLRLDFPPCCLSLIQACPVSETRGSAGLPAVSPPVAPSEDSGAMVPWSPQAQPRGMFLAPVGLVSASGARGRNSWGLRPGLSPFLLLPEPARLQPWSVFYQLTDGPADIWLQILPTEVHSLPMADISNSALAAITSVSMVDGGRKGQAVALLNHSHPSRGPRPRFLLHRPVSSDAIAIPISQACCVHGNTLRGPRESSLPPGPL